MKLLSGKQLLLTLSFFLAFIFVSPLSCKYELVQETSHDFREKKNAADYEDFIIPPAWLKASKGLSKCVELEWESVPNAVQYQVFCADSPYDSFTMVSETKDADTKIRLRKPWNALYVSAY